MEFREITKEEERLLDCLINKSKFIFPSNWKEHLLVSNINDGNMGSLYLSYSQSVDPCRSFYKSVSECNFYDSDGVFVVVTLNIDRDGVIFELDVWKVDFTPLKTIPPKSILCSSTINLI